MEPIGLSPTSLFSCASCSPSSYSSVTSSYPTHTPPCPSSTPNFPLPYYSPYATHYSHCPPSLSPLILLRYPKFPLYIVLLLLYFSPPLPSISLTPQVSSGVSLTSKENEQDVINQQNPLRKGVVHPCDCMIVVRPKFFCSFRGSPLQYPVLGGEVSTKGRDSGKVTALKGSPHGWCPGATGFVNVPLTASEVRNFKKD